MSENKIQRIGSFTFGLMVFSLSILAVFGGAELLEINNRNIKLVGFYSMLILMITRELYRGIDLIFSSFRKSKGVEK